MLDGEVLWVMEDGHFFGEDIILRERRVGTARCSVLVIHRSVRLDRSVTYYDFDVPVGELLPL